MTKTPPPNHQWVETQDGSHTLFSEHFQEACHSTTGAREETQLHYIRGCQVIEKIQTLSKLNILEVGFGLGIGFLETYQTLSSFQKPWHFLSLELDRELLKWFAHEHKEHPFLSRLQWREMDGVSMLEASDDFVHLTVLCGDARVTFKEYAKKTSFTCDAIYQDAFSPKRNPVLWTTEWFEVLRRHASGNATLSTYSASTSIRKSLLAAGWSLHKGERFGPKRTSTRAYPHGESDPEILEHLARSPVAALTDESIKSMLKV